MRGYDSVKLLCSIVCELETCIINPNGKLSKVNVEFNIRTFKTVMKNLITQVSVLKSCQHINVSIFISCFEKNVFKDNSKCGVWNVHYNENYLYSKFVLNCIVTHAVIFIQQKLNLFNRNWYAII